jgi:[ribosomal protein S18]-alanine N-acetyltransferase
MTGTVTIERAGPAHPLVMAAIHGACFPPGEAWDVAVIAAQLGMPGVYGFVCEPGGMILARTVADEAEILTLAVYPEARGKGIGASLVSEAARHALDAGATRMYLEVSEANMAARALYLRAGFVQIGLRRGYYPDGADALVLSRGLRRAAITPAAAAKS